MNYYEEFGISRSASAEEIGQAHKRLARLFHPDRIQEPELRPLAESQMKRVNNAYAVLNDPERRREYDESLGGGPGGLMPVGGLMSRVVGEANRNLIWIVAALACVLAINWFFTQHSAPEARASTERAVHEAPPTPIVVTGQPESERPRREPAASRRERTLERKNGELRAELRRMAVELNAARSEVAGLREALGRARASAAIAPVAPVESAPLAQRGSAADPESTPRVERRGLAGTWVYVPRRPFGDTSEVYPPEYIETVIIEEGGRLFGRYRGRYRVADRAISPEVVFRFEGEVNDLGRYLWTGSGGARGEVHLELVAASSLQVEWFASHLGRQMGLGSGSAVLIRRRAR